jgi:hypothetical protein
MFRKTFNATQNRPKSAQKKSTIVLVATYDRGFFV